MAPTYRPRDFDFSRIIQGMQGLQVDPVSLDDAISTARKLEAQGLSLEQEKLKNKALADSQADQEAYKSIDPDGNLSPQQVMDAALKIAAKQGDVKTVQSVLDHQTSQNLAERKLAISEANAKRGRYVSSGGNVYEIGEDGVPRIKITKPPAAEKTKLETWVTPGGRTRQVDANDETARAQAESSGFLPPTVAKVVQDARLFGTPDDQAPVEDPHAGMKKQVNKKTGEIRWVPQ